jgi:hypothetical protein
MGRGGKYFDDDDEDDDDEVAVDVEHQDELQSVLWESERIMKVSCQYLYYWLRYSGYRGRGGKYFDDDDEDVVEGHHEGQGLVHDDDKDVVEGHHEG